MPVRAASVTGVVMVLSCGRAPTWAAASGEVHPARGPHGIMCLSCADSSSTSGEMRRVGSRSDAGMEWSLALIALGLLGVAAVSRRLSGSAVTPAILFVFYGLIVGSQALDGIDIASTSSAVRTLAEATLAFVLFCDASRIKLGRLLKEVNVPARLLGIGLPLTIALGAVPAAAVFDALTVGEAVIPPRIPAPTHPALGATLVMEAR